MFSSSGNADGILWSIEGKLSFEGYYFAVVRVGTRTRRTEAKETEGEAERAADNLLVEMLEEVEYAP